MSLMRCVAPLLVLALVLGLAACGGSSDDQGDGTGGDGTSTPTQSTDNAPVTQTPGSTPVTPTVSPDPTNPTNPTKPSVDDPGAKPTATCTVTKDANGFFARGTSTAYVPPTYDGSKPVPLVVGLHGCGDNAKNFASWALSPYDTRKTQEHIAISIGGRDGACWQDADEASVLAAIKDISGCFWVHQQKIVMAGYSSGGMLAYRTAVKNSNKFAGLIIENSGFYGAGDEAALLAAATNKFPIAHIAHQSDGDFPIAQVQADWTKIKNAGFPMQTSVVAGTHNGTSTDWTGFLLPKVPAMKLP